MQLSYRHASICAYFSFNFVKKSFRDQGWPTAPLFVVNISPSFEEFTAPLRHILPNHNFTINSNNFFCEFPLDVYICVEKTYERLHLTFGGTLDRRCHFKHVKLKAGSTIGKENGSQVKDQGRRECCHIKHKKFPYRSTREVSLLSGHAPYKHSVTFNSYLHAMNLSLWTPFIDSICHFTLNSMSYPPFRIFTV